MLNINSEYRNRVYAAILLIAPFLYLLPYTLPIGFKEFEVSIGNDFRILYYNYKVYLLHFFSNLDFPLWSPSESSGYPLYSNPFVQYFYPLNILLALFYKVFGGYTVVDHIRYTVLGLSVFSIGLFFWLKTIKIKPLAAFISALLFTASIGSLEMLRFPNAVHTLCWFPFVLFSVSRLFSSDRTKDFIKYSLLLLMFSVFSVTAGYPYFLYYFMFILIPYVVLHLFKYTRAELFGNNKENVMKPLFVIIITSVICFAACYPYLKSVFDLVSLTTNRGGNSYEFSTASSENPLSTLGSLIFPPLSIINTSFYFGLINLMIIILYSTQKLPDNKIDFKKWVLLLWIAIIIYITYGSGSLLFNFLWNYIPGFSSLREWGRMNKILLILFAWLLGLAYTKILFPDTDNSSGTNQRKSIVLIASVLTSILMLVFGLTNLSSIQWVEFFVKPKLEIVRFINPSLLNNAELFFDNYWLIFLVLSVFSMLLVYLYLFKRNNISAYRLKRLVIFAAVIFSFIEFYIFAPWLWLTGEQHKERKNLGIENVKAFSEPRTMIYKTVSNNNTFNAGIVADWYYKSYVNFLNNNAEDTLNLKKLLGVGNSRKIFLSTSINHKNLKSFFTDSDTIKTQLKIVTYTGDNLEIQIDTEYEMYVNYIDNWDKNWKAFVNDKEVSIELLFGTFKSIFINKGVNYVMFVYKPF